MQQQKVIMEINRMAICSHAMQLNQELVKEGTPILLVSADFVTGKSFFRLTVLYKNEEFDIQSALQDDVIKSELHFFEILNEYFLINEEKGFDASFFPNGADVVHFDKQGNVKYDSSKAKSNAAANANKTIKKRRAKNKAAKKARRK